MADTEKIIAMTRSELVELVRQILAEIPDVTGYAKKTDIPSSLPANGGDADTVGGKSPSDFLPFQAYAPIYTGDIKDISNMGTYSCYKGNCTNLPDIEMWAYVIMIRFRDAGYKTFLCIEFNPSPTTQHCRNIYIAREYDVDSSRNMIWYKACDGGNADTVGGVGITNLRQITQTVINTLPTVPNGEGDFLVNCDTSDTSFPYQYGHLSIRYGSYTGEYVAIFRTTGNDNKIYYNTYLANHWSGWQEISATPIKSTTFSGTTNSYGDMLLFNKSENKIPLFVSINDSYCIPLLSGSSDYYVHIINVDNTVAANVSKSGTLYYSEFKAVIV